MKRNSAIFLLAFIMTSFLFLSSLNAIDKVAEVAGETISWLQLQNRYEKLWKQYQEDKSQFPQLQEENYHSQLQKMALDRLIEEELFKIYAKENDISIEKQEVDAIFKEIYASQPYFCTNGQFDEKKYEKFQKQYPQRYQKIVKEIKKDFVFSKIKQIIQEQFQITDKELYRRYIRENSKIKLKYSVVPDSLMPTQFPSTPFYLKEYYKDNRSNYKNLYEVKIDFIFIDDKEFLPEADSYQEFIKKYKDNAHQKAEEFAKKHIEKLKLSHGLYSTDRHIFSTEFLRAGDKIGNLENSEKIVKQALKLDEKEIFEDPVETKNGWIIFRTDKIKTIRADNLQNIALHVWQDYIEKGKELYFNNLVSDYYHKNIANEDIFRVNYSYLKIPVKSLDFNLSFEEDSTTVEKYYQKNIEEYVTVRDTLPLEKIRESVIEDLIEDTTKALTDSLLDTLKFRIKQENDLTVPDFPAIAPYYAQQIITNLPYFRYPLPIIIDTLSKTKEDSVFRINKNDDVYIGRINSREKIYDSRKKRLKPKIEKLFREKIYEERDQKFQNYYQTNKDNFYKKDEVKFKFLYIPVDSADIEVKDGLIKKYYDQNNAKLRIPTKVKLSSIFLPQENASKINEIRAALKNDVSFDFLANLFSASNNLVSKNKLYIPVDSLKKKIRKAVEEINIGETTSPIKTKRGTYLVKLLGREQSYLPQFNKIKTELKEKLEHKNADSLTFDAIVAIYDSLETNPYFENYDSLGYVKTTEWVKISKGEKVVLDSNLSLNTADIEIINRTTIGKILPKIYKTEKGYAIVKVVNKRQGEKITGYDSYKLAQNNFYKVYRYKQCRIFTDSLINYTRAGNDTIVNYLGGFKITGWLSYSDKIDNFKNSRLILFDAFAKSENAFSSPIRFSDYAFGFYQVLAKKVGDIADFQKIKDEYRQEYYQECYSDWLQQYKKANDVIILDKSLREE